jgi:hypothetical protein
MTSKIFGTLILLFAICKTVSADSCYVYINGNEMAFNHSVNIDSLLRTIKPETISTLHLKNVKRFTEVDFKAYPKMWRLEIGFDSITETKDWKLESNAQEIFISDLKLNNLNISECPELNRLFIARCTIKFSFVFHSHDSIDDFFVSGCDFTQTASFDVTNVKRIDLYNNKMSVLPEFIFSPMIYRVDLSGNKFSSKLDYKRLLSKKGLHILLVKKSDYTPEEMSEIRELAKRNNVKLI